MKIVMAKLIKGKSCTVVFGDSAKMMDDIEPQSIHAVVTDPPY